MSAVRFLSLEAWPATARTGTPISGAASKLRRPAGASFGSMAETRKSDFTGEIYGDWTVIGRGESGGDRKRRWVVQHGVTGVEMTVLQTGLSDLALAKKLADKAAETDAARQDRTDSGMVLTPAEAETALLARLDKQIAEAVGNPFTDPYALAEQEIAAGDPFGLSPSTLAIMADRDRCRDCEDGGHPIEGAEEFVATWVAPRELQLPPAVEVELQAAEADLTAALQDATGDDTLSVVYDRSPLSAFTQTDLSRDAQLKARLFAACHWIDIARRQLNTAEDMLCEILEGMLP